MKSLSSSEIVALSDDEVDAVYGGPIWVAVGAVAALAGAMLLAYQVGQDDGRCHG